MKELTPNQQKSIFGGWRSIWEDAGREIAKKVKAVQRYINRAPEGTDCGSSATDACG